MTINETYAFTVHCRWFVNYKAWKEAIKKHDEDAARFYENALQTCYKQLEEITEFIILTK